MKTMVIKTIAGTGVMGKNNGKAFNSTFNFPCGVSVDGNGVIFISDYNNNVIRKLADGKVTIAVGSGMRGCRDGSLEYAQFNSPNGITIDYEGTLYIGDFYSSAYRKVYHLCNPPAKLLTKLTNDISQLILQNTLSDIILNINKCKYTLHKNILSVRAPKILVL